MSPKGRILGISCPDPVASYSLNYIGQGHRIASMNLDLLNPGPLPARHPQNLDSLAPGQTRQWTIFLEEVDTLDVLKSQLAESAVERGSDCGTC